MRAGPHLVGVRPGSVELARTLETVLAAHVVPDASAPPTYVVRRSAASGGFVLQHGCATLLRTASGQRLVTELESILSSHERAHDPSGVRLPAAALIGESGAFVVDGALRPRLVAAEGRLAERGVSLVSSPWMTLDAATAGVTVHPRTIRLERGPFADATGTPPPPDTVVEPGVHPVRAWAWRASRTEHPRPWAAEVIRQANARVSNLETVGAQRALATIAESVQAAARLEAIPLPVPSTTELLRRVLDGAG